MNDDAALLNATCAVVQVDVDPNPVVKERADALSHASRFAGLFSSSNSITEVAQ